MLHEGNGEIMRRNLEGFVPVKEQLTFDFIEPKAEPEIQKIVLPYFASPKCDNERLLNYQYEFREKGNKNALNEMYRLGLVVAVKFIKAKAKNNLHIAEMPRSEKKEKAHNAITYIVTRYLKIADFAITDSFTSYLFFRVLHELFHRREVDKVVDFLDAETIGTMKTEKITRRPKKKKPEDLLQLELEEIVSKKLVVIDADGTSQKMTMDEACREFRLTQKQIDYAVRSGHRLKTMFFDEAID